MSGTRTSDAPPADLRAAPSHSAGSHPAASHPAVSHAATLRPSASDLPFDAPATIYLLADHLDAVLASGEDLQKLSVTVADPTQADGAHPVWQSLYDMVAAATELELNVLSRTMQARVRARDVARYDDKIAPLLNLFSAGTAVLADATAELADSSFADFHGGTDPTAYLRARGVLPAQAATVQGLVEVAIGEDFLVARRVPLGTLMDLTARVLDALEASYGLFPEDQPTEDPTANMHATEVHATEVQETEIQETELPPTEVPTADVMKAEASDAPMKEATATEAAGTDASPSPPPMPPPAAVEPGSGQG